MTELFHQLGHRYGWSVDSLERENTGDGMIIGPRYMARGKVVKLSDSLRTRAIFDPQFFLPRSTRGTLATYPFFPQVIAGGFQTSEWSDVAAESARQCLEVQIVSGFKFVIVPTRVRDGMPSDFIDSQEAQFVAPFLEAWREMHTDQPLLLQLLLTDQMLKDRDYRTDLLNWITALDINGVYLIYYIEHRRKQLDDIDFLVSALEFVAGLKRAEMTVVIGYCNTESLLLLAANPDVVTVGSYENLRMFNLRAFQAEESPPGGPNARIYIPRLLQWIEHDYIGAIDRATGEVEEFIEANTYRIDMFKPSYNWHFTKPEPYKHYFLTFSKQFERLSNLPVNARIKALRKEIVFAQEEFDRLESCGIVFQIESSGYHIPKWLTALNLFEKNLP